MEQYSEVLQETYNQNARLLPVFMSVMRLLLRREIMRQQICWQWFIDEQSEEEENALQIVDQLNLSGQENGQQFNILIRVGDKSLLTLHSRLYKEKLIFCYEAAM